MSDLHVSRTQQEMEENGEMDFIRAHVAAAMEADGNTPPAVEPDTVESEPEVEEVVEDSAEEEVPADVGIEPEEELSDEEQDTLYLELDERTQALIDSKYGGDINKALAALPEAQSKIGQQGNEMGALRAELEAMEARITASLQSSQPYADWPDEFDDASTQAAALQVIAEQAFDRRDPETFDRAIKAWHDADPVSAGLYRNLKEMQVAQIQQTGQPLDDEDTLLEAEMQTVISEFPQFQTEDFQAQVASELDKTPSLKAVLWGEVPGVSPRERATILQEAAQRVVARTTSETAQQARRRIAVRTSEEARAARVAGQVARGSTARETAVEAEPRTVPLGDSARVLNIDRLNAMLPEGDRI